MCERGTKMTEKARLRPKGAKEDGEREEESAEGGGEELKLEMDRGR